MKKEDLSNYISEYSLKAEKYEDDVYEIVDSFINFMKKVRKIDFPKGHLDLPLLMECPSEYVQSVEISPDELDVIITVESYRSEGVSYSLTDEVSFPLIVNAISKLLSYIDKNNLCSD